MMNMNETQNETKYRIQAEDIQIRAYENCAYLDIYIGVENEHENNLLKEALSKLPLPKNFSFHEEEMVLEYTIEYGNEGFACDIGWLVNQFRMIFNYAEALMPYQKDVPQ